jgi:hypothetical protein
MSNDQAATIHQATRVPGGVERGAILTEAEAIARRRLGFDIVVCGDDTPTNRDLAQAIEQQVDSPASFHDGPHRQTVGPRALPHWCQPRDSDNRGHSFYETHATKSYP